MFDSLGPLDDLKRAESVLSSEGAGGFVEFVERSLGNGEIAAVHLELSRLLALGDEGESAKIGEADLDAFELERALAVFGRFGEDPVAGFVQEGDPVANEFGILTRCAGEGGRNASARAVALFVSAPLRPLRELTV